MPAEHRGREKDITSSPTQFQQPTRNLQHSPSIPPTPIISHAPSTNHTCPSSPSNNTYAMSSFFRGDKINYHAFRSSVMILFAFSLDVLPQDALTGDQISQMGKWLCCYFGILTITSLIFLSHFHVEKGPRTAALASFLLSALWGAVAGANVMTEMAG